MNKEIYYVIAFDSTHHAIKAEKKLKERKVDIKTIPTPREITASCGLSIRFSGNFLDNVKDVLSSDTFNIKGLYRFLKTKDKKIVEKVKL
ncbi:DUF3343 domain-containing protein [Thermohalobacter berrensis]|uniref:Putative Se/S carrier protein-like domain-containing protein n=1 Tax=Thermohalobacter berrensis TaxID=99594 RepID=A0A419T3D4_9FIRM|nr:DUF3343 domain-containing protein [Thermohalobacter berrensis]RKD32067.1 hypothetical protein BET03_11350 [Thermohalobacter berrensis]